MTPEAINPWISLMALVAGIVLTATNVFERWAAKKKNIAEANKADADVEQSVVDIANGNMELAKMLTAAATELIKPLKDQIEDLKENNRQKDVKQKALEDQISQMKLNYERRINGLEHEVQELRDENAALRLRVPC